MTSVIENLEAQLRLLQGNIVGQTPLANPPPVTPNQADLESLINNLIDKKLQSLSQKSNSPMNAILSRLDSDTQKWLSTPEILDSLSEFILTAQGMEFIDLFLTDFRDFHENKTRSNSI